MDRLLQVLIIGILTLGVFSTSAITSMANEYGSFEINNESTILQQNRAKLDYSHTIFCEYGTATTCGYCKYAHRALKTIYDERWHPFYYVSFVTDKNVNAESRIEHQYNIWGYPTIYFDGGYEVNKGVYTEMSRLLNWYNNSLVSCGERMVSLSGL